jgi:arylformamidase
MLLRADVMDSSAAPSWTGVLMGTTMNDATVWNGFTQSGLDMAYDNRNAVANSVLIVEELAATSASFRATRGLALDVAYGEKTRQTLDLFSCGKADSPLFVFFHGGYWLRNSKDMFAAIAEGPLSAGFDVALVGYTLAPEARVGEIVTEAKSAVEFLKRNAETLGISAGRIITGGWSAGGHLAACSLELPEVDAALPISGIYELEPIRHCNLNETLHLTAEEAAENSPMLRAKLANKPMTIVFGGGELPELQRQSLDFAKERLALGLPTQTLALPGLNHFSILAELASPTGQITRALAALVA